MSKTLTPTFQAANKESLVRHTNAKLRYPKGRIAGGEIFMTKGQHSIMFRAVNAELKRLQNAGKKADWFFLRWAPRVLVGSLVGGTFGVYTVRMEKPPAPPITVQLPKKSSLKIASKVKAAVNYYNHEEPVPDADGFAYVGYETP